nr:retrovirus-related Pol polyprotein from transposon TNT 1-94 [Tanacetum cinerariifolium]
GYVYLLKHKHEVFENFKVFKSEVELQRGKKIKALRSDRGGEYLSQEFKDYLRYPKETMGYYFYFPPENKMIIARYGNFLERDLSAPNRLCLNIEVEDDEVGDLREPANYKAVMLDLDKVIWQGAMDEEMNSMKVMKV